MDSKEPNTVSKMEDNDSTTIWYSTPCSCHGENITATVSIEDWDWAGSKTANAAVATVTKKEQPIVSLSFYYKMMHTAPVDYYSVCWLAGVKNLWYRGWDAINILRHGYIEVEGEFLFKDTGHAEDFANALTSGIEKLKRTIKNKQAKARKARKTRKTTSNNKAKTSKSEPIKKNPVK